MDKEYLVILAGSPRGGDKTWESLINNVLNPLKADLALCTTENFVRKNILFNSAQYLWIMKNYDNFENYYEKYYSGSWSKYLNKGEGYGLYESGKIHFAFKDFIKRNHLNILKDYKYIIYSRFDQFFIDVHPNYQENKIMIPKGEDYFGICDRHAVFSSKDSEKYLSIVEYINEEDSLNNYPEFPNCESVYYNHLKHVGLFDKIERFERNMFTSSLSTDKTNWRVPKYKILLSKNLMIKYPDEFIDAFKGKYKRNGFIKYIIKDFPLNLTYLYLNLRRILGKLFNSSNEKNGGI